MPWTATSRAGPRAVHALYEALLADPAAVVLLAGDERDGAFAAGTSCLRETTRRVQRHLLRHPWLFLALAARHVASPAHAVASRAFDAVLPRQGAGYVLTIGATPASPVRGHALLAAVEAALARGGAREIWVDSEADNEAAHRMYERAGYRAVAERHGQALLRKTLGR